MREMEGFLDIHALPCVRIGFRGCEDREPVYIDTGFNRALFIPSSRQYELARGLRWEGENILKGDVAYADGRMEQAEIVFATIEWFGVECEVMAFLYTPPPRRGRRKDPILLGTELLVGCTLEVNFPERRVRIMKP